MKFIKHGRLEVLNKYPFNIDRSKCDVCLPLNSRLFPESRKLPLSSSLMCVTRPARVRNTRSQRSQSSVSGLWTRENWRTVGIIWVSGLRLVSRYETRGSETGVAACVAENNLGRKVSARACNLHSLLDGKCSVYKYISRPYLESGVEPTVLSVWQLKVSDINSLRLQSISVYISAIIANSESHQ